MSPLPEVKMAVTVRGAWALPILGFMLLVLGLVEYPYARFMEGTLPVLDATSYLRRILLLALPSVVAFLVGWKLRWLDRVEKDVQSSFWICLAFALALLPPGLGMFYAHRNAWRLDLPGIALHVDAGLASLVAFFAWIASLKAKSVDGLSDERLGMALFLGLGWFWVVSRIDDYFLFANLLVLPVAIMMLLKTPWLKTSLTVVFLWLGWWIFLLWLSPYRRQVLARSFFPFYDPYGHHWAAIQAHKVLVSAGFFGSNSLTLVPRAGDQYILITLAEHLGWLGMGLVIVTVTLFFILSYFRLIQHPASWLRNFSLCLWGFLLLGSIVNLVATLGLTNRPGLGIQFISHNWVLAALAAFITGVTLRDEKMIAGTRWPYLYLASSKACHSSQDGINHAQDPEEDKDFCKDTMAAVRLFIARPSSSDTTMKRDGK